MTEESVPAAFALLENERNVAADAALVDILPDLEGDARGSAIDILARRGHAPSLTRLVGRFHDFDGALQRLISCHAHGISAGLRSAVRSSYYQLRANAIDIVEQSDKAQLAYLLADSLRSSCVRTRKRAADSLNRMTAHLLRKSEASTARASIETIGELGKSADRMAEALAEGVRRWESHFQPKVLEAAMWLGDRTEASIREKLSERHTKIDHMLRKILTETSDTRLAGFTLRALAIPELRPAAARAITRSRTEGFLRAVLGESWLLADPKIEQGCRWITAGRWCQGAVELLMELSGPALTGAVRFLMTIGGGAGHKAKLLRELIGLQSEEIRRAVADRLVKDRSESAVTLLTILASRPGDSVARIAIRELRHRAYVRSGGPSGRLPTTAGTDLARQGAFEQCWNLLDDTRTEPADLSPTNMFRRFPTIESEVRDKLASSETLDRVRALRLVSELGLAKGLEDRLHALANDGDPVVRSSAVGMLNRLPGPVTERLLRLAVNDPDDRVQANAIEALDRLDADDRARFTAPKLGSPDGRVRANAIKSLLRLELHHAGEALLEMLEDRSATNRLSAVWVIERLRLLASLHRLKTLGQVDPSHRVRLRAQRVFNTLSSPDSTRALPAPEQIRSAPIGQTVG